MRVNAETPSRCKGDHRGGRGRHPQRTAAGREQPEPFRGGAVRQLVARPELLEERTHDTTDHSKHRPEDENG